MARHWQVLAVTSVAVVMVFLDGTIVNVAFPSMQHSFRSTSQARLRDVTARSRHPS
jgi:hypothetical protein